MFSYLCTRFAGFQAGHQKQVVAAIARNSADLDGLRQREAAAARAVGGAPNIKDEGRGPSIDICFSAGNVIPNESVSFR